MSRSARFHCGRTKRCMAIAPSMTCCCGACCMGSRAATTRRPPRRFPGRSGLSGSTVSRAFIEASAAKLRELQERDLSREDVVALVLDGKTFAESTMVVALGITMTGEKRFLGFVETDTENEKVLTPFLRSLVERGLDVSQGLLVIVEGGKGLRAAVRKAFRHRALGRWCTVRPGKAGQRGVTMR